MCSYNSPFAKAVVIVAIVDDAAVAVAADLDEFVALLVYDECEMDSENFA